MYPVRTYFYQAVKRRNNNDIYTDDDDDDDDDDNKVNTGSVYTPSICDWDLTFRSFKLP